MVDRPVDPADFTPTPLWMATFLLPLDVEYVDGRFWRVIGGFDYESAVLGRIVTIPSGFLTDFASIPRMLWPVWPPTSSGYGRIAVVHDALYHDPIGTRRQADAVLYEGMVMLGAPWGTRWAIWTAVRLFGARFYEWPSPKFSRG